MAHGLLKGHTALITGAGRGIGRAVAREFAAEGASVALIDDTAQAIHDTSTPMRMQNQRVLEFELPLTNGPAVSSAIDTVIRQWQHIDILVTYADLCRIGSILEDSLNDWRSVLAVNLEAVYMISKLVVPHMIAYENGRVIHISSVAGNTSQGRTGSYDASKAGLNALTRSMAVELAPYYIAVNAIAAGDADLDPQQRNIPIQRPFEPEDVAGAAVFLASDYCRYMTGQVLVVDGGLTSTY